MAITYKVLGQSNPAATTNTTVYTVTAGSSAVISTINICNQSAVADTFRIAVVPSGQSIAAKHYIAYNTSIPAYDSISLTIGITMAAGDTLIVYAGTATLSFNVFGSEIA